MATRNKVFFEKIKQEIEEWIEEEGADYEHKAELLWAADLFQLLCTLIMDEHVPARNKAGLGMAIAYYVSPADLLPEGRLGPAGYIDDVVVGCYVIEQLAQGSGHDLVLQHWHEDRDLLAFIRDVNSRMAVFIGEDKVSKVERMFA